MTDIYSAAERRALAKLITFVPADRSFGEKNIDVAFDAVALGTVYSSKETIERRPKRANYVTKRWSRPCWRTSGAHRVAYRSCIEAAAALVNAALRDGGALAGKTGTELLAKVQKMVAEKKPTKP